MKRRRKPRFTTYLRYPGEPFFRRPLWSFTFLAKWGKTLTYWASGKKLLESISKGRGMIGDQAVLDINVHVEELSDSKYEATKKQLLSSLRSLQ